MNADILQVSEECTIKNVFGTFKLRVFRIETKPDTIESVPVIYKGLIQDGCLTRINSACITSETFGDMQCDCKWQLDETFRLITKAGSGLIIYISHHEGRGVGIFHKVKSMHIMESCKVTSDAAFKRLHLSPDIREYDFVCPILNWFGLNEVSLITNNPIKVSSQKALGIKIIRRVPLVTTDPNLKDYLKAKKEDFGHLITLPTLETSIKNNVINKKFMSNNQNKETVCFQ